ncbi:MAG: glycosyltransferase family 39 protein [Caulobacteraceae bacterium]|nr:glycosyltransferase family 39 protein [Caulobacteraceae bacterium]
MTRTDETAAARTAFSSDPVRRMSHGNALAKALLGFGRRPSLVLALATLVVHLIANSEYGVFRDELYFIVCGRHLAAGYVDQPPLAPWIAGASYALFGTALLPLRLVPALAMSVTVGLTAEMSRRLGGRTFAQWLAGLCVLTGSVFLVNGLLLTTDMLQPLTWLGCSLCLVRLAQSGDERWWLPFGLVLGVSLLSKYLIAFYLAGLAVGILATPLRRSLTRPWVYAGGAIGLVIAAPSLVWQTTHGWPFLELGHAAVSTRDLPLTAPAFAAQQVIFSGMAVAPVWMAGLWRFSARPSLPQLRVFPIAYVVCALLFFTLHGKAYYLTPIYPALLAGGALAVEDWVRSARFRAAILAVIAAVGLMLAPFTLPVLPVPVLAKYSEMLGLGPKMARVDRLPVSVLPENFADMLGWQGLAAKVSAAYQALPPDERAKAVFFGWNYGQAAAIDVYGPAMGLPPAISGHNNYYLWGPAGHDGSVMIVAGGKLAWLRANWRSVEVAGWIDTPYAMPVETNIPIYVLKDPKIPLAKLWPSLKHYE